MVAPIGFIYLFGDGDACLSAKDLPLLLATDITSMLELSSSSSLLFDRSLAKLYGFLESRTPVTLLSEVVLLLSTAPPLNGGLAELSPAKALRKLP